MVSNELLKRYPFFGVLNDSQLKEIAMIAEEIKVEKDTVIFEECDEADSLYLLIEGSVELSYRSEEEFHPKTRKEFYVGDINPGEIFAISSLIEPYALNATAKASQESRLIKVDAIRLRKLFDKDIAMAYHLMAQVAKFTMERLADIRVQLAAAQS